MTITKDEVLELENTFHDVVMLHKGSAADQGAFFLHPEPRIIVPHGDDLSLQDNYEVHQKLVDEAHVLIEPWDVTPLCSRPDRVRATGVIYWQGRPVGSTDDALVKILVGEEWIIQRVPSGELRFALYMNPYHHFLPDSAPISF